MRRPFLSQSTFQHRSERQNREAAERDAKRLRNLGDRIEQQRAKRRRQSEAPKP
jgi:hypothetical protein